MWWNCITYPVHVPSKKHRRQRKWGFFDDDVRF